MTNPSMLRPLSLVSIEMNYFRFTKNVLNSKDEETIIVPFSTPTDDLNAHMHRSAMDKERNYTEAKHSCNKTQRVVGKSTPIPLLPKGSEGCVLVVQKEGYKDTYTKDPPMHDRAGTGNRLKWATCECLSTIKRHSNLMLTAKTKSQL